MMLIATRIQASYNLWCALIIRLSQELLIVLNPDEDAPNATLPEGAAAAAAADPRVRVLPMKVNSLNNRYHVGARAKTQCLIFVDDDVLVDPEDLIGEWAGPQGSSGMQMLKLELSRNAATCARSTSTGR